MKKYYQTAKSIIIGLTVASMVFVQPVAIAHAADETVVEATTETPAVSTTPTPDPSPTAAVVATTPDPEPTTGPTADPGPNKPNGADAATYVYNADTGMWENAYYIWDPVSHQTRPKQAPSYYYDPTSGTWSTDDWTFDPASGKYIATPQVVEAEIASLLGLVPPTGNNSGIANTGPDSNNQIDLHDQANGLYNLFSRNEIANYFNMDALTGNADVDGNTIAGSANTGDANNMANIVNLLRSAWNITGGKMLTFMKSIFGDVDGDIMLNSGDPSAPFAGGGTTGDNSSIAGTGPDSNNTIADQKDGNLTVVDNQLNNIDNDLHLNSTTGNANVSGNTKGGDATSGNARVLLNLMNLISSAISSHDSFFGVLNIFGNLNGDILFPKGFLDKVLQSGGTSQTGDTGSIANTGPGSNNTITDGTNRDLTANTNNIDNITNNITTNAQSGSASVDNNTSAGSATTGNSDAKITLLNLTGRQVLAKNALLVFVNVFGKWVGLIMDAPAGSHSALVGGGVDGNVVIPPGTTTFDANHQNNITNNIDLTASTGNATVEGNTEAGNAKSGDAQISGNVANIIDSSLNLANWFGVLFINVFGNWNGSFGVDTPAGNQPVALPDQQSFSTVSNAVSGSYYYTTGDVVADVQNSSSSSIGDAANDTAPKLPEFVKSEKSGWTNLAWPIFSILALVLASALFPVGRREKQA